MTRLNTDTIVLPPFKVILANQTFVNEKNCIGVQLNYQPTGGSFSISVMKDLTTLPGENFSLSLPFGRVGIVKNTGRSFSTGGLIDTISGPAVPFGLTQQTFLGVPGGQTRDAASLATAIGSGAAVLWATLNPQVKNFIFRGIALSGIQQLAQLLLADVFVRAGGVFVIDPGTIIGPTFNVEKRDIVGATQNVDFSLDIKAVLNPALTTVQLNDAGTFVYDAEHAQKQPKFTVQAGAPGSAASTDFIPIPDGWLVDGVFEEWTPPSGTDFTNPSASVPAGRYWKVFQSPTSPGNFRGITQFTRLVKELRIPGNVSSFIGSPITDLTRRGTTNEFNFDFVSTESGISGFSTDKTSLFDVISNQFLTFDHAIVLVPNGLPNSGFANANFFSITMEIWTFPRINPTVFPVGGPDPTNPFNLPKDVVVVNPSSNVVATSAGDLQTYWNRYLNNHRRINSPRLRTQISVLYRGIMPEVGDGLFVKGGLPVNGCGRIQSVSLSLSRGGIVLNISAEVYNYGGAGLAGLIGEIF